MSCCDQIILENSPKIFNWLTPVSQKPDPFLMDRNHAYITPDNSVYVLSFDGLSPIRL